MIGPNELVLSIYLVCIIVAMVLDKERRVSKAYWLLPLFLQVLGGIIAWIATRKKRDRAWIYFVTAIVSGALAWGVVLAIAFSMGYLG